MAETVDEHFQRRVGEWTAARPGTPPDPRVVSELLALFEAQVQSRHLDLAARWLQSQGEGFYTIGSAGHESNAAVALATRPTDPALLHYRSGGFYAARAAQVAGTDPITDVLAGVAASVSDQISGGRHKVFGNASLGIVPQTSTIGSHLPRSFGLAFALGRAARTGHRTGWPPDAIVVTSLGDASLNHSTTQGALNAGSWLRHQGAPLPWLVVVEDNGLGISVRSPQGWVESALQALPGFGYLAADGDDPHALLATAGEAAALVRSERRPVVLHLRTVRFMGHAGSDAEIGYRSPREIQADLARDPLLATARAVVELGAATPEDLLRRYSQVRITVMSAARDMAGTERLASPHEIAAPLFPSRPDAVRAIADDVVPAPDDAGLTLAQTVNRTLSEALRAHPDVLLFGEDVARKGGVYGVTRGLWKEHGPARVFDTLLDEQTILGTALGTALAGHLPVPEIQYLAYVHNAEDQLRGEAASLRFFSAGQYENGMVVRVPGLGYQKGFGGHFHNDDSLAVLRDVPGVVVAVPSHPARAAGLLRECLAMARAEGRVCVYVEPIALYHRKDLFDGDGAWLAPLVGPDPVTAFGRVAVHGRGGDVAIVTFGNGVPMSLRAARELESRSISSTVVDLQWLTPLPVDDLLAELAGFDRVLVVDETRRSGGVSESVVTALVDSGFGGRVARVASADSFVPLGPAASAVLVSEQQVVDAAVALCTTPARRVEVARRGVHRARDYAGREGTA